MLKPVFIRTNLSDVKVIMEIMRLLIEELLCQAVTGYSSTLVPVVRFSWAPLVMSCHALH
jgi:hypothetical protein